MPSAPEGITAVQQALLTIGIEHTPRGGNDHHIAQVGLLVDNHPPGDMFGAKRGDPQVLESLLDNEQRHAGPADDLMNTAENPTEVVATDIPHEDADR
jgi:hypothetical protein